MAIDPQAQVVLDLLAAVGFTFGGADPVALREQMSAGNVASPIELASITDRTIPGPAGGIPVRIYRPTDQQGLPVVVFFHGGGWVVGDLESHDHMARAIAAKAECVVVAVDYRLAPEHRFPAAVDDSWAATEWVATHADELGVDGSRLAVAGDSAGGNLAAVVTNLSREVDHVEIIHQALIYPVTDATCDRPSMTENAEGYMLTADGMDWFHGHYANGEADRTDPRYSPLFDDLTGAAPATVITAGFDPLRDQGIAYAEALGAAGVATEHINYETMFHGFFSMDAAIDVAAEAQDAVAAALKAAFAR
ncbi:MAG: alpha/beta hydrolase [Acidobacteria bacterium]|nr:alpha/beta hydrolase [Acidobacteriota bacterium]